MRKHRWGWVVTMGVLVGLSGCAAPTPINRQLRDMGYSKAYAIGYEHGVCTGRRDASGNKWYANRQDRDRYESDPEYRQGYDDGYRNLDLPSPESRQGVQSRERVGG
jgi:hypothetical protein